MFGSNKPEWIFWDGWIGNHDHRIEDAKCSNCGFEHPTVHHPKELYKFCPGCRKRMKNPNKY